MSVFKLFNKLIRKGAFRVINHQGHTRDFGDGSDIRAVVQFMSAKAERQFCIAPHFYICELYANGQLQVQQGSFFDFCDICAQNATRTNIGAMGVVTNSLSDGYLWLKSINWPMRAKRNVARHYDLDARFFRLFLDPDLQYSCAYFKDPANSLADAQWDKKIHLATKLNLKAGQHVLDIGCGWGGMAIFLAKHYGVKVTGITLSEEQHRVAHHRIAHDGLSDLVQIRLQDYRHLHGQFDRIISVGMFEHVGRQQFETFFKVCRRLLSPDGIMILHTIAKWDRGGANPWLNKYIFPGGYLPSLAQLTQAAGKSELLITDMEILRLHYALTLRHWRANFIQNWDYVIDQYGVEFARMWEAYLSSCEVGFLRFPMMNAQIQLCRDRHTLPLTRDYMAQRFATDEKDSHA